MENDFISRAEAFAVLTDYYHHKTQMQAGALTEALSRVPLVDAVKVVRCVTCLYYDKHDRRCKVWNHGVITDGYCHMAREIKEV